MCNLTWNLCSCGCCILLDQAGPLRHIRSSEKESKLVWRRVNLRIELRVWGVLWGSTKWCRGDLGVSFFLRGARPEMAAVKYPCLRHKWPKCITHRHSDFFKTKNGVWRIRGVIFSVKYIMLRATTEDLRLLGFCTWSAVSFSKTTRNAWIVNPLPSSGLKVTKSSTYVDLTDSSSQSLVQPLSWGQSKTKSPKRVFFLNSRVKLGIQKPST
jgi:hypothetical protein